MSAYTADKLVFAATARCLCGAGMAYVPTKYAPVKKCEHCGQDILKERPEVLEKGTNYWDCSAILMGTADQSVQHEAQLPFAFYEIKSERQPSAAGQTTRPK